MRVFRGKLSYTSHNVCGRQTVFLTRLHTHIDRSLIKGVACDVGYVFCRPDLAWK